MLQASSTQKIFMGYNISPRNQAYRNSRVLSTSATVSTLHPPEKKNDHMTAATILKDIGDNLTSSNNCSVIAEDEEDEQWPQIDSIAAKAKALQTKMKDQRRKAKEMSNRAKQYESMAQVAEQDRRKVATKMHNYAQLENRVKQLQNILLEKDNALNEKQKIIQDIQFRQIKKNADNQEKIRRLSFENKDFFQRLRAARNELERERQNFKELRDSMSMQIDSMRSQKEKQLAQEMDKMQQVAFNTRQQTQIALYKEIDALNRKIYLQEQQIQRKNIQFSFLQRKKQQAINETIDKKDQEIKIQKSLMKSLHEKVAKLQQQLKEKRKSTPDLNRGRHNIMTRSLIMQSVRQQQVTLELSPDKDKV